MIRMICPELFQSRRAPKGPPHEIVPTKPDEINIFQSRQVSKGLSHSLAAENAALAAEFQSRQALKDLPHALSRFLLVPHYVVSIQASPERPATRGVEAYASPTQFQSRQISKGLPHSWRLDQRLYPLVSIQVSPERPTTSTALSAPGALACFNPGKPRKACHTLRLSQNATTSGLQSRPEGPPHLPSSCPGLGGRGFNPGKP